jgi:tRNA threonylcarbamoyladenosine biosynthesis protein TsaB
VTAAKTLAYATGAVLVGLDTLEALARNAPGDALRIAVIADAQRGDLYVASFVRDHPGQALRPEEPCRVQQLPVWLDQLDRGVFVLGPGLDSPTIRAAIPPERLTANAPVNYPDAGHLIDLALDAEAHGRHDDWWDIEPRYLRRSAAEEKWPRSDAAF